MLNKAQVVASSFSGMDALTEDAVSQVMLLLDDLDAVRTVVTNAEGRVLYDSSAAQNLSGGYALFPEIVGALEGSDVFYCISSARCICSTSTPSSRRWSRI